LSNAAFRDFKKPPLCLGVISFLDPKYPLLEPKQQYVFPPLFAGLLCVGFESSNFGRADSPRSMQFSKLLTGIDSVVMKLKSSPTWRMIVGGT
jgi:hypothetical protein